MKIRMLVFSHWERLTIMSWSLVPHPMSATDTFISWLVETNKNIISNYSHCLLLGRLMIKDEKGESFQDSFYAQTQKDAWHEQELVVTCTLHVSPLILLCMYKILCWLHVWAEGRILVWWYCKVMVRRTQLLPFLLLHLDLHPVSGHIF